MDIPLGNRTQTVGYHHQRVGYVDHLFVSHVVYEREGGPYGHAGGVFEDNLFRFLLLCLAACEAPLHLQLPARGMYVHVPGLTDDEDPDEDDA